VLLGVFRGAGKATQKQTQGSQGWYFESARGRIKVNSLNDAHFQTWATPSYHVL
jgi:hypothetical protein